MSKSSRSSTVGSALILAGTAIGAGMLALPLVAAGVGFLPMLAIFAVTGVFAIVSGLLTYEANISIAPGVNLYTMAHRTLGRVGRLCSTLAPMGLFYALMTAYLSGGGNLFFQYSKLVLPDINLEISIVIFAVFSAGFVYYSTRAVDYFNRLLFAIMIVCLVFALLVLLPSVDLEKLTLISSDSHLSLIAALPVVYTSFGYHGSIPSIILYKKKELEKIPVIIMMATLVPFLVYASWLIAVMGNVAATELLTISESSGATITLIETLSFQSKAGTYFNSTLFLFSNLALLTSLLGVALGLFDYLANLLQRNDGRVHRAQTGVVTFLPPVLFAVIYPDAFVAALGYAAIALATLAILLPSVIVLRLRSKGQTTGYRVMGGNLTIYLCILFAALIISSQLITISTGF